MEQTIGRRIAENRKRLGMTQDQLAEKLGVSRQTINAIEKGDYNPTSWLNNWVSLPRR